MSSTKRMSIAKQVTFGVIVGVLGIVLALLGIPIGPQTKIDFWAIPVFFGAIAGTPIVAIIGGIIAGIGPGISFGSWWATGELAALMLIIYALTNLTRLPFSVRPIVGVIVAVIVHQPLFGFPLQYIQGVPGAVVWGIIVPKTIITDTISGVIAALLCYSPQIRSIVNYFPITAKPSSTEKS